MKVNQFKKEMIIDEDKCMGDIWHNEDVRNLVEDVRDNKLNGQILELVYSYSQRRDNTNDTDWIHHDFTKGELRKLNALMKSKSKKTLEKRKLGYLNFLTNKSVYSLILNKNKIQYFSELFGV